MIVSTPWFLGFGKVLPMALDYISRYLSSEPWLGPWPYPRCSYFSWLLQTLRGKQMPLWTRRPIIMKLFQTVDWGGKATVHIPLLVRYFPLEMGARWWLRRATMRTVSDNILKHTADIPFFWKKTDLCQPPRNQSLNSLWEQFHLFCEAFPGTCPIIRKLINSFPPGFPQCRAHASPQPQRWLTTLHYIHPCALVLICLPLWTARSSRVGTMPYYSACPCC